MFVCPRERVRAKLLVRHSRLPHIHISCAFPLSVLSFDTLLIYKASEIFLFCTFLVFINILKFVFAKFHHRDMDYTYGICSVFIVYVIVDEVSSQCMKLL